MTNGDGSIPRRAVISYAHDSADHRERVRRLWHFLRLHGVNAWSDFAAAEGRQEWPRTMEAAIDRSEFILIVASPEYRRRAAADRPPGQANGRGVEYEAGLIRELMYRDRHHWFPRVLPVVLPGGSAGGVPDFLLPFSATVYYVRDFTIAGAEPLLRVLTAQPGEIPPEVAAPPHLPPRPAPATERESLIEELIAALRTLPVMANAGARAQFVTMTTEQLGRPANIPGDLPIDDFLPALVGTLDRMPGGLAALADVVRALHRDQSVEREIRRTVERLATLG